MRRVVVVEAELERLQRLDAGDLVPGEHRVLELGERGLEIISMGSDGRAELRAVEHREVGTLTVGRRQVRGIAE